MTSPGITDNLDLATKAQEIADSTPAGSLRQTAAKSVAVTCATTRNVTHARTVLHGLAPDEVRQAALKLLNHLAAAEG